MFDAITLSTGDIDFLKIRTVGDSGDGLAVFGNKYSGHQKLESK
jgi:predicted RNA-binding protein with TRAM domain